MVGNSSTLAWRIPWTEEPCGLQFMGSQRVRHDGVDFTFIFTVFIKNTLQISWIIPLIYKKDILKPNYFT